MSANVFFDIPKVQQVDLLSNWLVVIDIAFLDGAICSHNWRPEFLSLISSPELTLDTKRSFGDALSYWAIQRKVSFSEVDLSPSALSNDVTRGALLDILGPKLRTISLRCKEIVFTDDVELPVEADQVIFDVTQHCRNLTKFSIYSAHLDGALPFLFNANQLLEEVTINECKNITANALKEIIKLPHLTGLYLQQSTVADTASVPKCEHNLTCEMLMGRYCKMNPKVLSWLCQSMPNLVKIHLDVQTGRDLECIANHCRLVTLASITLESSLTVTEARNIAKHWQSIELFTLLRCENKKHLPVCDEAVALVFINKCKKLLQLKLAPSDAAPYTPGDYFYSRVIYGMKSAALVKTDNTRSRLTELFVSSLSAQALATIVQKCVYLNTLHIVHPAPTAVEENAAEFALHHLSGTSVKSLLLVNCSNLNHTHLRPLHGMVKLLLTGASNHLHSFRLLEICKQSPDLHSLYIYNCPGVGHYFVLHALEACPKLTHFEYCLKEKMRSYRVSDPAVSIMSTLVRKVYLNLKHFVAQF